METKISTAIKLFALMLVIIAISIFAYTRQHVEIKKITDLSLIQLPADIKQQLAPEHHAELMYVLKKDKVIQYYFADHNFDRCLLVLERLKSLATSIAYGIPDGDYLITLHDEAYQSFAWPVLAFAATQQQIDDKEVVLMPDSDVMRGYGVLMNRINSGVRQYPWNKKQNKIFWRGVASGANYTTNDINGSKRLRFLNAALGKQFIDARFTDYTHMLNDSFKQKLANIPHLSLTPAVSPQQSLSYKYLIDVDGHSCSFSRMAWILYSNSVLMKHTSDKIQWYYHLLKPYQNYIPIKEDFSDLQQQYEWAEAHPQQVLKISKNARAVARRVFSEYQVKIAFKKAFQDYHAIVHNRSIASAAPQE